MYEKKTFGTLMMLWTPHDVNHMVGISHKSYVGYFNYCVLSFIPCWFPQKQDFVTRWDIFKQVIPVKNRAQLLDDVFKISKYVNPFPFLCQFTCVIGDISI